MDTQQLLEFIVPILFIVVWTLSRVFGRPKKEEEEEQQKRKRRPQHQQRRARQAPPPVAQSPFEGLFEPEGEDEFPEPEPLFHQPRVRRSRPKPVEKEREDYQAQLLEQLKRAKEIKRQLALTKAKRKSSAYHPSAQRSSVSDLREDVLALLDDPRAARKAILYAEVLGTPVGLRKEGAMAPLWNQ